MSQNGSQALLPACPNKPNCVSSLATGGRQYIAPLPVHGEAEQAMARLRAVVEGMSGAHVIRFDSRSMHAVFVTRWLRFRDDVHFALDDERGVIHVRSASRVGHSDLGTNRRRVEAIRTAFVAAHG